MSAPTPGPWALERESNGGLEPAVEAMPAGYAMYVATAHDFGDDGATANANARLIAAAPDLLTHLKVMMAVHCPQPGPECGACEHARGLVAAAEGKS